MRRLIAAALAAGLAACAGAPPGPGPRVKTGLDALEADGFAALKGKRVGVITNRTGVDAGGRSIVDLLAAAPGVTLSAVFSPEHGFAGVSEKFRVDDDRLTVGGRIVPLYSLYRDGVQKPRPEQLSGLDALVFDVQDAGARFYTYPATMAFALEAARDAGIEFVVLDRPNPVGGALVEGPILTEPALAGRDPVAFFPIATRHGMTVGELAMLANATTRHPRLTVIKMRGWTRRMRYDDTGLPWIPPSPNLPDLAAAELYPGVANLEFTNLSVGRGTPRPFGWIGAPWLDAKTLADELNGSLLEGVEFEAAAFTPTKDAYEGQRCPGVRIVVTDRDAVRPLRIFAAIAASLRGLQPNDFQLKWEKSRRLIGMRGFRELYERGASATEIAERFDADADEFAKTRAPYLLYPDR